MQHIIIADNQAISRMGLFYLLSRIQDKYEQSECCTKEELILQLRQHPNASIIVDYTLFDFLGDNDIIMLTDLFPSSYWLLFSDELSAEFLQKILLNSQQVSIVMKDASQEELVMALQHAIRKQRFVCNFVSNLLLTAKYNVEQSQTTQLTETEKSILREIALGYTTKDIATKKYVSFHTVNTHRKNIFRKLGINNVHEATKYAMRAGIIDVAEYCI